MGNTRSIGDNNCFPKTVLSFGFPIELRGQLMIERPLNRRGISRQFHPESPV